MEGNKPFEWKKKDSVSRLNNILRFLTIATLILMIFLLFKAIRMMMIPS